MKANIHLAPYIPFIVFVVVILFLLEGFDTFDVITILGGGIIIGYFILGFIRRKDALLVVDGILKIKTPIKTREYNIAEITELSIKKSDNATLKANYQGETITLCTDIYDVSITEIKDYLLKNFLHITEKSAN